MARQQASSVAVKSQPCNPKKASAKTNAARLLPSATGEVTTVSPDADPAQAGRVTDRGAADQGAQAGKPASR